MSFLHVSSSTSSLSKGRQLCISCLPALGAGLLIFWLSGGFPPTAWVLLFQMGRQIGTGQGTSLLLPFGLLIGQSLAIGGAWGCLLVVIVQEGTYLQTLWSEDPCTDELLMRQQEAYSDIVAQQPVEEMLAYEEVWSEQAMLGEPGVEEQMEEVWGEQAMLGEPGVEGQMEVEVQIDEEPVEAVQAYEEQVESASDTGALAHLQTLWQNPFEESIVPVSEDVFANVPDLLENVFDTQLDDLDLFARADNGFPDKKAHTETFEEAGLPDKRDSAEMFVFGNPFEGPLPEIFAYDRDLKDMLKEVKGKSSKTTVFNSYGEKMSGSE